MIAAFGNSGRFDDAVSMIQMMPSPDDPAVWLALAGACKRWGNVELGRLSFDKALQ
jgi:Flp pilus assembly protein TadD